MKAFRRFRSKHDDLLHDIAYDFYGKRLATCSSDQKIKVWDQNGVGEWKCTAEFKAHSGSVHKLSWAHPEFGQVLASCSADRMVHIYEEQIDARTNKRTWKKQAALGESRDSVQDIQFAPRHHGLKVATGSLDGRVRIYESTDVMNLSVWPLVEEFEASKKDCFAVSWNPNPFDPPMLAVGSQASVKVWEYHHKYQKWQPVVELDGFGDIIHDVAWAPNMGRTYHLIATASKDGFVRIHKLSNAANKTPAAVTSAATAAAAAAATAKPSTGASAAASSGATATATGASAVPASGYTCELVAKLGDHKAEVWRVSWNITGTMLASTGDDGTARLWKSDFKGRWHSTLVASAAASSSSAAGGGGVGASSSAATAAATPAPQSGFGQSNANSFHFAADSKDDHKM